MNKVSFIKALLEMDEELKGGQKKLDLAKPKGKITAADFVALRAKKSMKEDESPVDWPKEIPSKYADEFLFIYDESKPGFYNVQDIATGKMVGRVGFNTPEKAIEFAQDKIKPKGGTQSTQFESEDHEVSMAQNSLKSIISSASQLMNYLGQDEKDIPAWIQDHITNAENYINQASKNYHEYNEGATSEYDMDELPDGTEEKLAGDAEDKEEMFLKNMMEDLFEAKKKKPSAGLSKKQKSAIVKKAKAGKDFGKKGPGFEDIEKKAKASGAKNPAAVAGAAFWKAQAKKAK